MITQEKLKELLSYDKDAGVFTWAVRRRGVAVGAVAGYNRLDGYIQLMAEGKLHYAHRIAWLYVYGELPKDQIDHINGVKTDNRICNLRLATNQENQHNKSSPRTDNTSGFLGVSWSKPAKKWRADIRINGRKKNLGFFNTADLASEVYLKTKRELHPFWV